VRLTGHQMRHCAAIDNVWMSPANGLTHGTDPAVEGLARISDLTSRRGPRRTTQRRSASTCTDDVGATTYVEGRSEQGGAERIDGVDPSGRVVEVHVVTARDLGDPLG